MPGYFGSGYISWLLAQLLPDRGPGSPRPLWVLAALASFIGLMWDLAMGPARATVHQAWIWADGGAFFGVHIVNFAGWFLCVLTIFLACGLAEPRLIRSPAPAPRAHGGAPPQALGLYAALFVEFPISRAFADQAGTVADADGQIWTLRDIYQSLGLASTFTMGFVILMCLLKLAKTGPAKTRFRSERRGALAASFLKNG